MLDATITVFNFCAADEKWYPSILHGADVEQSDTTQATTRGQSNGGGVNLIIPCSRERVVQTGAGGKSYTGPKVFSRSTGPASLITFAPECDFVYLGAWPTTEPLDDDDYDEGLYHELNRDYDDVYMIHSVAYFDLLPHFEIRGE